MEGHLFNANSTAIPEEKDDVRNLHYSLVPKISFTQNFYEQNESYK